MYSSRTTRCSSCGESSFGSPSDAWRDRTVCASSRTTVSSATSPASAAQAARVSTAAASAPPHSPPRGAIQEGVATIWSRGRQRSSRRPVPPARDRAFCARARPPGAAADGGQGSAGSLGTRVAIRRRLGTLAFAAALAAGATAACDELKVAPPARRRETLPPKRPPRAGRRSRCRCPQGVRAGSVDEAEHDPTCLTDEARPEENEAALARLRLELVTDAPSTLPGGPLVPARACATSTRSRSASCSRASRAAPARAPTSRSSSASASTRAPSAPRTFPSSFEPSTAARRRWTVYAGRRPSRTRHGGSPGSTSRRGARSRSGSSGSPSSCPRLPALRGRRRSQDPAEGAPAEPRARPLPRRRRASSRGGARSADGRGGRRGHPAPDRA